MYKAVAVPTLLCKDCKNPYKFVVDSVHKIQFMMCDTDGKRVGGGKPCRQYAKRFQIPEIEVELEEIQ